ncbi:PREDICTED: uncharacterized protein LOC109128048 [Camelina sativa]|uniref:Uncharacterized protein LOC109128048 n=1 Tax=Camelina sativa TaxID=90675 RepID=A0ABM1QRA4_CAMSA|nr:PREDICTED: uncharacterized protein LOC109128048 [Camelina sativa]
MVIKRIELCIELMKIGMEFVVVVAEAVQIVMRQNLNHRAPPQPPRRLIRQGLVPYPASHPSPFLFGFFP